MHSMHDRELLHPVEGNMLKFTNVMKGWQYRWFRLDPERGCLEYYVEQPGVDSKATPRGTMHLGGAVISPTDEDDQTFTVSPIDGEPYKLRTSVKDRQFWIQRLRAVAQMHTDAMGQEFLYEFSQELKSVFMCLKKVNLSINQHRAKSEPWVKVPHPTDGLSAVDALGSAHSTLQQCISVNQALCGAIESLPTSSQKWKPTEPSLLVMKATSQAGLAALQKCFEMLQTQHVYNNQGYQARGSGKGSKKTVFNAPRKPTKRTKGSISTPKNVSSGQEQQGTPGS